MENELALEVSEVSDLIETEPWGFEAQQSFLNAAMRFELPEIGQNPDLCSHALLRCCKKIESQLGRADAPLYDENGKRQYFSRPIDIDILFYGTEEIKSKDLIIPHLYISERDFVLIPLRQIAKRELINAFPLIFN